MRRHRALSLGHDGDGLRQLAVWGIALVGAWAFWGTWSPVAVLGGLPVVGLLLVTPGDA